MLKQIIARTVFAALLLAVAIVLYAIGGIWFVLAVLAFGFLIDWVVRNV